MTDTRDLFERTFALCDRQKWQHKDGSYKDGSVQKQWEGWQRALATVPSESKPVAWLRESETSVITDRQKEDALWREEKWANYYTVPLVRAVPAPSDALPRFMLEKVQQAINEATQPNGMSLHDGRVRIDVSILSRLLLLATSVPPAQPTICSKCGAGWQPHVCGPGPDWD